VFFPGNSRTAPVICPCGPRPRRGLRPEDTPVRDLAGCSASPPTFSSDDVKQRHLPHGLAEKKQKKRQANCDVVGGGPRLALLTVAHATRARFL